ncbi:MAG: TolC family protein [Deltaproteobacteria bacterium]|nr:TolC family protein [Deltaproteobacteria bacterium]
MATQVEAPPPHLRDVAEHPTDMGHGAPVTAVDPISSQNVTLAEILAYADAHSPSLRVARSARARVEVSAAAASMLLPSNPQLQVAVGPRIGQAGTGVDLEIGLSQQVQIAGERGLRGDVADRFAQRTDAEIEQSRWAVHCDVHAAFHGALVERERLKLARGVLGFQEEVLRVVERQIKAGETAPLALRLAQAEVAQARQVLVASEQGFFASKIRLAQLAGWPTARPPEPSGSVDEPRDAPAIAGLLAVARDKLPSLRVGTAVLQEAEARLTLARREAWPKPSVGAQYRREGNPTDEGAYQIVLGVLSIPIPSFDTNQIEQASARAELSAAEAELEARRSLLEGQITEAHSELVAAAQRTRAYGSEILPRFEENLTLLRRSFELGEIDILALSVGRERFLRIQSDALNAQFDYFIAMATLERAVGVDLWRDEHHEDSAP